MDAVKKVARAMRFVLAEGLPVDASLLDAWRDALLKAGISGRPELLGVLPRVTAPAVTDTRTRAAALTAVLRVIDPPPGLSPAVDRERIRLSAIREQIASVVSRMEACVAATRSDVADWAMDLDMAAILAGEETPEGKWLIWAAQCLRMAGPSFRQDFAATRSAWMRRLREWKSPAWAGAVR